MLHICDSWTGGAGSWTAHPHLPPEPKPPLTTQLFLNSITHQCKSHPTAGYLPVSYTESIKLLFLFLSMDTMWIITFTQNRTECLQNESRVQSINCSLLLGRWHNSAVCFFCCGVPVWFKAADSTRRLHCTRLLLSLVLYHLYRWM